MYKGKIMMKRLQKTLKKSDLFWLYLANWNSTSGTYRKISSKK